MKAKHYFLTLLLSIVVYLCLMWTRAFGSVWISCLCFTMGYALLTYLVMNRLKPETTKEVVGLAVAVAVGSFLLELPLRVVDFVGTYASLLVPIIVITGIGLTALCYVKKSMVVLTLSFIIVLLLNTVVMHEWLEFCSERLGMRCF